MNYVIATSDTFSDTSYQLLELTPELENEIANKNEIYIVGKPEEKAVLCTSNQSYNIVKEDTSNLRLLFHEDNWNPQDHAMDLQGNTAKESTEILIYGSALSHYALQKKQPDMNVLLTLLLENPYELPEHENSRLNKRLKLQPAYKFEELLNAVQVSKVELVRMLEECQAFKDEDDCWRILSPNCKIKGFEDILGMILKEDWDWREPISLENIHNVALAQPDDFPSLSTPIIIRQCCLAHGQIQENIDGKECYQLHHDKIATFVAESLLREGQKDNKLWELQEFLDKWSLHVPNHVQIHKDFLKGLVIYGKHATKSDTVLNYFPEHQLPMDPKKRFDALFQWQNKWTLEEIEPYISVLVQKGDTTQASLLLKYARASRVGNSNQKVYSKR